MNITYEHNFMLFGCLKTSGLHKKPYASFSALSVCSLQLVKLIMLIVLILVQVS